MERPAGQGREPLLHQGRPAVDQPGGLRAVRRGAPGHRGDVRLVVLADVGGVGARHGALLAHPRDRYRGVEAAGESDTDTFADRQGGEYLGHECNYMHTSA